MRSSNGFLISGASNILYTSCFQVLLPLDDLTIATVFWNCLRPAQSSPSSGISRGKFLVKKSGEIKSFPNLDINFFPSQKARTPSNFSLIQYPVGF